MSVKQTSIVWEHSKQSGNARLLLLCIADFADDAGYAWPSIPTLSKKVLVSERQIQYLLKRLIEAGELRVLLKAGPVLMTTARGLQRPNLYQVLVGGAVGFTTSPDVAQTDAQRGAVSAQRGAVAVAPKPSLELPRTTEPPKQTTRVAARKDSSALQMAKDATAWEILAATETKFGWRLPKSRRREEHRHALELLELWPSATILQAIATREKAVTSLKWLADFIPRMGAPVTGRDRPAILDLPPLTDEQAAENQRRAKEMVAAAMAGLPRVAP